MRHRWRTPMLAVASVVTVSVLSACTLFSDTPTPLPPEPAAPQPTTSAPAAKPIRCGNPLASYEPSNPLPTPVALPSGSTMAKIKKRGRLVAGVSADTYLLGSRNPFTGEIEGFDIDMAMALCEAMKVECTLVQQDWDGIIPALLAKKYDAIIASMSITDERKKTVDFTNKYYQTPARFVARKGAGIQITKEGLKGKKVGVQRATIHDKYITDNYGSDVEVVRYGTADEANLDLVNGRVIHPGTGYVVDPRTGLLIDPVTGALLDPVSLAVVVPPGFGSDTPTYIPGSDMHGQIETVVDQTYDDATYKIEPPTDGPVQPIDEIIVPTESGDAVEIQ